MNPGLRGTRRSLRRWLRNPLRGPLGRRLMLLFLAFSMVPLLVSNTLGYVRSLRIIEDQTKRYLLELGEVEAQHIEGQVSRYLVDLQAIAAANEFLVTGARLLDGRAVGQMSGVATPAAVERYLRSKLNGLPPFDALYLQPLGGSPVLATSADPLWTELSSLETKAATLARIEGLPGARPRYRLTVPVVNGEGELAGYLGGVISTAGLAMLLEIPEHLAGSVESFIVDEAGLPLFVSHPHGEVDYGSPLETPLLNRSPREFAQYVDRHGVEVIGVMVPVEGLPWRYIAEAPISTALGPLQSLRRISTFLAVGLGVVVLIAAWLVTGGIVAPVRRLVAATRRVASGDLSVRVDVKEGDEIGELASSFNVMTAELAETSARVDELHRREIERAQQLATVGELASGVAHEIKNPLVGIANGMDLVLRRVGDDPELSPIADEMARQLERIESAVRDLLAYARPSEPTREPTELNRVVERAARLVAPAAERSGVGVEVDLDPAVPAIPADEELIRQAMVNLLLNAVQASAGGSRVTVRTAERDGSVEVAVIDRGRGITPQDLDNVFKPFYTTRHSGTGLGLSITREIVERHGGRVKVESRLGEGSTFTVVLPQEVSTARSEAKA